MNPKYDPQYQAVQTGRVESVASIFMRQVYLWMTAGLGLTAAVAYWVAATPSLFYAIQNSTFAYIALIIAEFGLVFWISARIHKMSSGMATGLFLLFSALNGAMLSSIFIVYNMKGIVACFACTAGTFLAMSIYGTVTKRDLSSWGSFLFMGLIGILIAMLVNIFLKSNALGFVISCCGVLVFTGLTAYDTQKIREFGAAAPLDDSTAVRRGAILGALNLYLDFINIFLMMLRLFGGGRD